jgi:hypothetical protein
MLQRIKLCDRLSAFTLGASSVVASGSVTGTVTLTGVPPTGGTDVDWRAEYTLYGDIYTYRAGSVLHQPLRLPGQTTTDGGTLYNNVYRWYRFQRRKHCCEREIKKRMQNLEGLVIDCGGLIAQPESP